MKRIFTLTLAVLMTLPLMAGCSQKQDEEAVKTPEELTELFTTAIESARDQEMNEAVPVLSSAEDEMAEYIFSMLGITEEDMTAYAVAVSPVNIRAYGIALIRPAADKDEAVKEGLQGFIDLQKSNFERYLEDQYEIAKAARLETLEDGSVLLVMCEGQDEVFDAIKDAVEKG